jgi:transcriptional regulator of arginine metabolism
MSETRTVTIAKARRQRLIADVIRREAVQSQEELVERLAASGVNVAQATISRDLDELGAVKVKRSGVQCYAMPGEAISAELSEARLRRVFSDWVETAESSGSLIVLRTPPGSAHVVGNALDHAGWGEVAGTVAGDDTLLVVIRDGCAVSEMLARMKGLAGLPASAA